MSRFGRAIRWVGRGVASVARQIVSGVKDGVNRLVGLPGFIASWAGLLWPMKMRLRVVILRDENNELVADPDDVMPSIEEARQIFEREANVHIQSADNAFILPLPSPAPPEALTVRCGRGAMRDELGKPGRYFKRCTARNASSFFTGYAAPITVFIVKEMEGTKTGCALGPWVRYATVSVDGLDSAIDPCEEDDDDRGPIIIDESPTPRPDQKDEVVPVDPPDDDREPLSHQCDRWWPRGTLGSRG